MSRSSLVSLAVGLLVAASLIAANDPTAILRTLLQAGWGVAAVVALHLPQILLSALGWRALIADPARPGIATLAHLRWVRESVNNLLPVARVGGEIVRGRMLVRRGVAGVTTAASLAVDLAVETATLVVFALLGLIALALLPNAGALGVQEGGYVLVCGLFGIPPEGALALSLVRRLRDLLLGLPGLAAWRWEAARAGRAAA